MPGRAPHQFSISCSSGNGGGLLKLETIAISDGKAKVWVGGQGVPLVLLHGGWAGASAHWSQVWEELEKHAHVIAPELPGLAADSGRSLKSFGAYAAWLEQILNALDVQKVWIAGNSFGATLALRFAAQITRKCHGVLLIDGLAQQRHPAFLRWLVMKTPLRRLAIAQMRRVTYSPDVLNLAFVDPRKAPSEIIETLTSPKQARLEAMLDIMMSGEKLLSPAHIPTQILWGRADRLSVISIEGAQKLSASIPNSSLKVIAEAGHLPQVERPDVVIAEIVKFINHG